MNIITSSLLIQAEEIKNEIINAEEKLKNVGSCIALFGSARLNENQHAYIQAMSIASKLSKKGYSIITGGGPGIMEAGNRGAYEAKGISIGLNITLEHEQAANKFQTHEIHFDHFASRKTVFMSKAKAYISFEGGYGTQDELWEALTLIQCGKIPKAPIVLFGKEYWKPAENWILNTMLKKGLISKGDENLYIVTDSIEEAIRHCISFK